MRIWVRILESQIRSEYLSFKSNKATKVSMNGISCYGRGPAKTWDGQLICYDTSLITLCGVISFKTLKDHLWKKQYCTRTANFIRSAAQLIRQPELLRIRVPWKLYLNQSMIIISTAGTTFPKVAAAISKATTAISKASDVVWAI